MKIIAIVGVSLVFLLLFYMYFPQMVELCEGLGTAIAECAEGVAKGFKEQAERWKELFNKLFGGRK